MNMLLTIIVTFFAGMGAGLGTGFAGMSAAAVISSASRAANTRVFFIAVNPFFFLRFC